MNQEPEELEVERLPRGETSGALTVATSHEIQRGPAWALARMTDEEFDNLTAMAVKGRERIQKVMRSMMRDTVHYGTIPGAGDKKNLLKPGGEVLRQMFRLVAEPETKIMYGDGVTEPRVTVECRTKVHADSLDGPVVAVGVGACTSWERKYRYRRGDRACPSCGKPTIRRSTFPDRTTGEKGWYCHAKVGGCGAQFRANDPAITQQQTGDVQNPDELDQLNTIVKMAKKRSVVDATIEATASSDLLTQDLEDMDAGGDEHPNAPAGSDHPNAPPPAARPPRAAAPKAAPGPVAKPVVSERPEGDALEAANKGRARFFAMVAEGINSGIVTEGAKANSPAGMAARRELIAGLLYEGPRPWTDISEALREDELAKIAPNEFTAETWHTLCDRLQLRIEERMSA